MGAACNSCNLAHSFGRMVKKKNEEGEDTGEMEWKMNYKVPVFFHNAKGYDTNFLIRTVDQFDKAPEVIAANTQKIIAFSAGCFQFKDSMGFMSAPLDKLAESLPNERKANLRKHPSIPPDMEEGRAMELLCDKGKFPYEYVTPSRLSETQLPPREAFNSTLYIRLSEEEYASERRSGKTASSARSEGLRRRTSPNAKN